MSGITTSETDATEAPSTPLIGITAAGNRCPSCGAGIAPAQRYCVECGARRGVPRFEFASAPAAGTVARTGSASQRPASSRKLLGAVAVLLVLVVLGLGFLVGRASVGTPNVYINAPGATSGSTTSGSSGTSGADKKTTKSSGGTDSSRAGSKLGSKCNNSQPGCVNNRFTGKYF